MAFLTPLYLLAGMGIALPILFHLIRQTPKGRQVFSSLMFLQPSPPRVTKRSRIEDWLLLLLRSLAVGLLAFAFARPFLRNQDQLESAESPGRRVAILVDTSASMQRPGLWESAIEQIKQIVEDFKPTDSLTLISFDRQSNLLLGESEWLGLDPDSRLAVVQQKLKDLKPGSAGTELGEAMIAAADLLVDQTDRQTTESILCVVSDFQSGSHWEPLNGYEWPTRVQVLIVNVETSDRPTNASLQLIASDSATDETRRIRVQNTAQANQELFEISWVDEFSNETDPVKSKENSIQVYVPPGQSQVVRAPEVPTRGIPQRLVLTGDQQDFDNTCFVARRPAWAVNILYIGDKVAAGPDSLRFFLEPVFPSTMSRKVSVLDWNQDDPEPLIDGSEITLLIVGTSLNAAQTKWAKEWVEQGGQVLFVLQNVDQSETLSQLLGMELTLTEATVADYEMLQSVDFSHPIFSPFNDPRFADFSKLRFWKFRQLAVDNLPEHRVLATFEEGTPAILELRLNAGRMIILAAGWNRSDSELAVWSKFVPLMNGLLEYLGDQRTVQPVFYVGDVLTSAELGDMKPPLFIKAPDGDLHSLSEQDRFELTLLGLYTAAESEADLTDSKAVRFAVNLPPDESKTDPLSLELLEAAGVSVQTSRVANGSAESSQESQRQLLNRELESKQQLWKWLLCTAIFVLLLETFLSGVRQKHQVTVPAGT